MSGQYTARFPVESEQHSIKPPVWFEMRKVRLVVMNVELPERYQQNMPCIRYRLRSRRQLRQHRLLARLHLVICRAPRFALPPGGLHLKPANAVCAGSVPRLYGESVWLRFTLTA